MKKWPTPLETFIQKYEVFRKYGEHENSLVNHRITWMLTIHGFLYATYGFTLQKLLETFEKAASFLATHGKHSEHSEQIRYCYLHALAPSVNQITDFLYCIVLVGFVISGSALFSIRAAYLASQTLHDIFYENNPPSDLQYKEVHLRDKITSFLLSRISYLGRHSAAKPAIQNLMIFLNWIKLVPRPMKVFNIGPHKFPILSGGGREVNEVFGSLAALIIPIILLLSWIISAYFLYITKIDNNKIFKGSEKCMMTVILLQRKNLNTVRLGYVIV